LNGKPIGIFDSGVGGLTVFSEIRKRFPAEDLIYFGDTARVPYGPKSKNTIVDYSVQNTRFLAGFQVKLIIVACNTSSAVAIDLLREQFSLPIIGVLEPGAEKAVAASKSGRIGIIGTEGTINSSAYPKEIKKLNPSAATYSQSCPLFVPLVEEGWQDHPVAFEIVKEYLAPLLAEKIDTLVLGCTHYPILKKMIKRVVGNDIALIDSAETISEYLENYLRLQDNNPEAKSPDRQKGKDYFYVSDNEKKFKDIASRILQENIENLVRVKLAESWFI
jgi:glutamate racemase